VEQRSKILVSTVRRLLRRGAIKNIEKVLKKTHTADLAVLVEGLGDDEGAKIFGIIEPIENRAKVLSYLEEQFQKDLFLGIDAKQAGLLVSHMDSDDAADLLGILPDDISKKILDSMVTEDSQEVVELMGYPEDSAGGLMTPHYLAVSEDRTISETIQEIQANEDESRVTFYVYVVNAQNHLVGVLSLKDLILSQPKSALKDVMSTEVISVGVERTQEEVARIVERYDFLSIPVVETGNKLLGVITVDDVIDVIREEAQEDFLAMGRAGSSESSVRAHLKARFPWLLLAFIGGLICFGIFDYLTGATLREPGWILAGFIPLVISLSSTAGHQSATFTVGSMMVENFRIREMKTNIMNEFLASVVFAAFFGILLWGISRWLLTSQDYSGILGAVIGLQILLVMFLGTLIPLAFKKLGVDPAIASIPLFTVLADISSISVLFGVATYYLPI